MAAQETILVEERTPVVDWRAIFAGAIASIALFGLFTTFGSALGLTMTSARPYAGFSATVIAIVLAIWFGAVQVASFAAGGYLAGRMRTVSTAHQSEREFRDGVHGFLVWALGAVLAVYVIASAVSGISRGAANVASTAASGAATAASSAVSATKGSSDLQGLIGYVGDSLLRPAPQATPTTAPSTSPPDQRDAARTSEIARILTVAIGSDSLNSEDRQYLARVIASRTGLSQADAERRVDETWTRLKNLRAEAETKVRDAAEATRKAGVLGAFLTAAISLAGLVAAAWGASLGGQHQAESRYPVMFGRQRFW